MPSRWKMTVEPPRVPAWPPVFAVAVVIGLLLATVAYTLSSGSSEKVVVALLTFFGIIITAAAKHFVDMRSEQRLRLDAAIEAGKLLSSTDGMVASPAAAASGLLALADLGRSKLAVAMLLDLWGKDAVSSEVAILIIDKALASGDDATAQIAAEVLCQNSHKLDPTKPAHWPTVLDTRWMPRATEKTKILLIESLVEMSTSSALSKPSVNALRAFAIRIVFIHDHEHHGHFRKCIAGFARAIAPHSILARAPPRSILSSTTAAGRSISRPWKGLRETSRPTPIPSSPTLPNVVETILRRGRSNVVKKVWSPRRARSLALRATRVGSVQKILRLCCVNRRQTHAGPCYQPSLSWEPPRFLHRSLRPPLVQLLRRRPEALPASHHLIQLKCCLTSRLRSLP